MLKRGLAIEKLRQFGYAFNSDGQLRKIDLITNTAGEEPFLFEISDDPYKNQQHYEKLAEQIPDIVYDLLEENGLHRTYIPSSDLKDNSTFIFTKPSVIMKPKKLLVLIHGSGFVRAGQWARSLIINHSLDHGTQLPYIKKAIELDFDIIIPNTNDNYRIIDDKKTPIRGLENPISHALYVWEKFVMASEPESVAVVAHSYGGTLVLELAKKFPRFFKEKVCAIALTDSAHFSVPKGIEDIVSKITCNWVSSSKPLDVEIKTSNGGIKNVSAGHVKHEWSSFSAFDSVFKFIENQYAKFSQQILLTESHQKKAKLDD